MDSNSNTVAAPANQAVAEPKETQIVVRGKELMLFDDSIFANTPNIGKTFGVPTETLDKNGNVVGGTIKIGKRKLIAEAHGLTMAKGDKDKLDAIIEEDQVKAFQAVRAWLLTRPDNSTGLARMGQRLVGKDGVKQTTIVIKDMPQRTRFYIEKLADAFGLTVEELTAKLEADKAAKAAKTVNVSATVTPAKK